MLVGLIDLFFFFAISLGADSLEIEPSPISILRSLSLIRLLDVSIFLNQSGRTCLVSHVEGQFLFLRPNQG